MVDCMKDKNLEGSGGPAQAPAGGYLGHREDEQSMCKSPGFSVQEERGRSQRWWVREGN